MTETNRYNSKCIWALALLAGTLAIVAGCADGAVSATDDIPVFDVIEAVHADGSQDLGEDSRTIQTCPEGMESCVFCKQDSDCIGVFPEQTLCQDALCDPDFRVCVLETAEAGASCSDGSICNGEELCQDVDGDLVCVAGAPLVCLDSDPCNGQETCDPVQGCVAGEVLQCDDADVCNGTETCQPGIGCTLGKPLACDDGDSCNGEEWCDPVVGCLAGTPPGCDDGDDCTEDLCDKMTGCWHKPAHIPGCCETDQLCDDSNACTDDWCDIATGTCHNDASAGACEDGDPCTADDKCQAGECLPGTPVSGCHVLCWVKGDEGDKVSCPLHLARTAQEVPPATTLAFSVAFSKDQLELATLVDLACANPDQCTAFNIPETGSNLFETTHTVTLSPEEPLDADGLLEVSISHKLDSQAPISQAFFKNGQMTGDSHLLSFAFSLAQTAPEAIPVVLHSIEAKGAEGNQHATAFAQATIVTSTPGCGNTLSLCFDGKPCTQDVCNAADGTCSYPLQEGKCDDGNPCTVGDYCDAEGDCVAQTPAPQGAACAGDNKCTQVGLCNDQGECVIDPEASVECPAQPSGCALYDCNPATGNCFLTPLPAGTTCDDESKCTLFDSCDGMGDCLGTPLQCNDGQECTLDSCNPLNGACDNEPDHTMCDDDNPCTTDQCTSEAGCTWSPQDGAGCNDLNQCTDNDKCAAGECTGTWNFQLCGCESDADCDALDDGNSCNGEYVCDNGACEILPASVVTCPAYAGDCALWECDPTDGLCKSSTAAPGTSCDAGPCASSGKCTAQGACQGEPLDCSDGDECTTDSCNPVTGCQFSPVPGCDSKFWLCEISGTAGDEAQCPLMLVRETEAVQAPVGADFQLSWNQGLLQSKGFLDEFCFGQVCVPKELPTCGPDGTGCVWGSLSPTGHNIVAVPKDLAQWLGVGTLLFFHPTDPFKKLSEAVLEANGSVDADGATILTARFKLLQDIPAGSPVKLWMAEAHFGLPSGQQMQFKVVSTPQGRAIVVF